MRYVDLRAEAVKYSLDAGRFIERKQLPLVWFDYGYDHLAIKAYSPRDYEELLSEFKQFSEYIAETEMNGRYIAMAHLVGNYGLKMTVAELSNNPMNVRDIELMLARPDGQTGEHTELDHAEIYMERGLIPVRRVLANKGIQYDSQHNDSHSWISTIINQEADELKFSDRRLADIVDEQLENGKSKLIFGRRGPMTEGHVG
jgi:hypothetical protein